MAKKEKKKALEAVADAVDRRGFIADVGKGAIALTGLAWTGNGNHPNISKTPGGIPQVEPQ